MVLRGRLLEMDSFGKDGQYKKAVFLDEDTFDKVSLMVSDDDLKPLSGLVGQSIQVMIGAEKKGYDYSLRMKSYKVVQPNQKSV